MWAQRNIAAYAYSELNDARAGYAHFPSVSHQFEGLWILDFRNSDSVLVLQLEPEWHNTGYWKPRRCEKVARVVENQFNGRFLAGSAPDLRVIGSLTPTCAITARRRDRRRNHGLTRLSDH